MPPPADPPAPMDPFESLFGDMPEVDTSVDDFAEEADLSISSMDVMEGMTGAFEGAEEFDTGEEDQATMAFDSSQLAAELQGEPGNEDAGDAVQDALSEGEPELPPLPADMLNAPPDIMELPVNPEALLRVEPQETGQKPEETPEAEAVEKADEFAPVDDDLIAQTLAKVRKRRQMLEAPEPETAVEPASEPIAAAGAFTTSLFEEPKQAQAPSLGSEVPDEHLFSGFPQEEEQSMATFSGPSNFDLQTKTPEDPFTNFSVSSSLDLELDAQAMEHELEAEDELEEDDEAYFFTMGFETESGGRPEEVVSLEEEEEEAEPHTLSVDPEEWAKARMETLSSEEISRLLREEEDRDPEFKSMREMARQAIRESLGFQPSISQSPDEKKEAGQLVEVEEPEFEEEDIAVLMAEPDAAEAGSVGTLYEEETVAITRVSAIGPAPPAAPQPAAPAMALTATPVPPEELPDIVDTLPLDLPWDTLDKLETAARQIMRHRSPRLRQRISAETLVQLGVELLVRMDLNQSGVRSPEDLLERLLAQLGPKDTP